MYFEEWVKSSTEKVLVGGGRPRRRNGMSRSLDLGKPLVFEHKIYVDKKDSSKRYSKNIVSCGQINTCQAKFNFYLISWVVVGNRSFFSRACECHWDYNLKGFF